MLEAHVQQIENHAERRHVESILTTGLSKLKANASLDEVRELILSASSTDWRPNQRFRLEGIPSSEFATADYRLDYWVDDVLTVGQPAIIAGQSKSLKTSIAIDLGISIASGGKFLGEHRVLRPGTVGVISGESGEATLQNTAQRICTCKGLDLAELPIIWEFNIPQISSPEHVQELRRHIQRHKIEVLILDPAYLALLDEESAKHASNVFAMGAVLRQLSRLIADLGVTLVLVHHVTKGAARANTRLGEPPELEDMAMAGFAEFARQWFLIGRRKAYVDNSGHHELWFRWGGSAGHGGLSGLDIREGRKKDVGGRYWQVTVRDAAECFQELESKEEARSREKKEAKQEREIEEDIQKLETVFKKFPAGETVRELAAAAKLSNERARKALNAMEDDKQAERCEVTKANGQTYPGFKPLGHTPDAQAHTHAHSP
ncbi:MAG: AAA family ATPase, partial [Planctomycetaceae bacterium]|nr:AAA family ATPase [Planctomycetaceae bacterium]